MKKTLIIATALTAIATPALAMGPFYVMFDNTTKHCFVMKSVPSDHSRYKVMGHYGSMDAAHTAMSSMSQCQ